MNLLSSFVYPQPDALSIFSHDNSSYWLLLFVRSELLESCRTLYIIGAIMEVLFLCSSTFLHGRSIYLCWKYKILHSNFLSLMTNFYASFQAGCYARIVLILYESRLISWTDIIDTPLTFLATVRQYGLVHAFCVLTLITIERCLATLHVADYESKHRHHIPALLIIFANCALLGICYAIVAGILNAYILCLAVLFPNVGCALILHQMLKRNRRKLTRLSDSLRRYPNDKYSLSLRVQLKENIWSLQKIEFGVLILIVALVFNLILLFLPVFLLTQPDQLPTLQWCMWAANIVLAISIAGTAPMGTFALALHTGARPFYVRWYLRKFAREIVISPVEVKETDTYFNQLHNQWNYAMRNEIRIGGSF